MNIGIDARLIDETGVGRYIRNLVRNLGVIDTTSNYTVFLKQNSLKSFHSPNSRWRTVVANVPWHSITEQIMMPRIFAGWKLDLVHIPYFNVPVFYPGRFVVTIHDLTILHINTGKATTLPRPLYQLRRIGYRRVLVVGLARASHIFTVSEETKKEIVSHFAIDPGRITVTYEAVDDLIIRAGEQKERLIAQPYFLYVGNAYPHKNLERLIVGFKQLMKDEKGTFTKIQLIMVGKDDFFYQRLRAFIAMQNLSDHIVLFGPANDRELQSLYTHAIALVFPSHMEGFGLPALEALACGVPVLASDIGVFHEVCGNAITYFDPESIEEITGTLRRTLDDYRLGIPRKLKALPRTYSWKTLARQTLSVYHDVLKGERA